MKSCYLLLAAYLALCASQPDPNEDEPVLPVLKEQPAEVMFKDDDDQALLECVTEGREETNKYTWHKNGQPFDWESTGRITQRPGEGSIIFNDPEPQDDNKYQCFVETPVGIASTREILLKQAYINIKPMSGQVKPIEHYPEEGQPYALKCTIPTDSYPEPEIVWYNQPRDHLSVPDIPIYISIVSPRRTVAPDGTLYFSNITESDCRKSYKYVCLAKTPASSELVLLAEHIMQAMLPQKSRNTHNLVAQYVSSSVMAQEGAIANLYCIYGGTPLAYPRWYKDQVRVDRWLRERVNAYNLSGGKRLIINGTLAKDQGSYMCEVDNKAGDMDAKFIRLFINSEPKLSVDDDNEFQTGKDADVYLASEKKNRVKEGQNVVIPCKVTGVPKPEVSWTYNAKPLGDRATYKNGVLTINNVKKEDTGYYGCKAENEHGVLYVETLIYVA